MSHTKQLTLLQTCSSSVNHFVILNLRVNLARSRNSRRPKLHGSQPCSPTHALVTRANQVALQGSASSSSCPFRASALPQQPCRAPAPIRARGRMRFQPGCLRFTQSRVRSDSLNEFCMHCIEFSLNLIVVRLFLRMHAFS